ncbi:uncharacterized protein L969DRAFT_92442 [Mixia osmundae IAM 14324]|uniref:ShKT domain-containing protein n=1 Tax=Mixia osmundae (strain CBS 9802 / IAM 14324 / JCM 22182 / KY 12970) TaxID=764103 RepID=G7DXI8_MIXOS|nr:uncharacterized protein L969DRAFT_92442 [Mixia osmundae IAM 14324]KEI41208.1 hypothetical protein L969DRAFT_92442 [Mixia osmundae IAM 14324]GAA95298.1 hypothetical protein E5Q_01955 [Mixia osmundae IAM 14324]
MQFSIVLAALTALFVAQTSASFCHNYNRDECLQYPAFCGWNAALGCIELPCFGNCNFKMQFSIILPTAMVLSAAQHSVAAPLDNGENLVKRIQYCNDNDHDQCLREYKYCGWVAALGCFQLPCYPNCKP